MSASSATSVETNDIVSFKGLLELTGLAPNILDKTLKRICQDMGFFKEHDEVIEYGPDGEIEYQFRILKRTQVTKPKKEPIFTFEELTIMTRLHPLDLELSLREIGQLNKKRWGI